MHAGKSTLQLKARLDLGGLRKVMILAQPRVSQSLNGAADLPLRAGLE